jgi:hypothetical protein
MSTIAAGRPVAAAARKERARTLFEWGGFIAAAVLIAFGVVAIVMGVNGHSTVGSSLKAEKIVGSGDMTPAAIKAEAVQSGLKLGTFTIPSKSVANQEITSGDKARTFAQYMRIHTLEATGGYTYSQMGRFTAVANAPKSALTPDGATNDPKFAAVDPKTKQPVANGARNIWVTETALTTALNTSYMASQLALFGIVVGVALLLSGIGFGVLSFAALHRKWNAIA